MRRHVESWKKRTEPSQMPTIRPATAQDAAQIAAIWNHYIRDTVVTFTNAEKSDADIAGLLDQKAASNDPFLVAAHDGIIGFATYGAFRGGPGYALTKEHSIMLAPDAPHGAGTGRRMMAALCDHGKTAGINSLIAGIAASNTAAVAFHTALGFSHAGHIPRVGKKFDTWHDLILMQRFL